MDLKNVQNFGKMKKALKCIVPLAIDPTNEIDVRG